MATIIEILDRVRGSITGYLSDLKTVAKNNLVAAINELSLKFVYGDQNQAIVPKSDNSSEYRAIDIVVRGAFVTTDAELAAAKLISVSPATIFSTWKRFSHGGGTFGSGSPVLSDVIPGIPLETNSWSYNSGTNTINSTVNSATHIGFYSPEKYSDYTHSVTFSASGGDNDFIATIIAYVEDKNDMVANNAFGLNPADFSWPIDVTSQFIPNQHTLTLVRGRTNQVGHPFSTPARYAIVYDMGKLTQQILVNGETSGVWNTTNSFSSSPTVDVKVIRSGDLIKTYTTDWSDSPTGKGALRFELSYDLSSLDITNKFRGAASYGFSAITQQNSTFTNDVFSQNINLIYDVRNGQKWVGDNAGNYSLSSTETLYTDFGANRLFFNPITKSLIEVWPDKTFTIVGGASARFGIEDNISTVDRDFDAQYNYLDISSLSYFSTTSRNGPKFAGLYHTPDLFSATMGDNNSGNTGSNVQSYLKLDITGGIYERVNGITGSHTIQRFVEKNGDYNIPISVNGNFADATGNITIASTGGGGTATPLSDNLTTTTTGTALDAHQGSVIKGFLDSKVPLARTITINGTALDLSQDRSWTITASGGSVTSVGLSMPTEIFGTTTNSPITGSGTLTPTLKTQGANKFLLGPVTGADGTPTFRVISNADIAAITGLLTALNTVDKSTLVAAINEVKQTNITQNQKINSLAINFAQSII